MDFRCKYLRFTTFPSGQVLIGIRIENPMPIWPPMAESFLVFSSGEVQWYSRDLIEQNHEISKKPRWPRFLSEKCRETAFFFGEQFICGVVQMDFSLQCVPLSGSSSELRGTYGAGDPGNGRFRSRAFQRALLHSERITDEKVTALQRQRNFRKIPTLSIRIQEKS